MPTRCIGEEHGIERLTQSLRALRAHASRNGTEVGRYRLRYECLSTAVRVELWWYDVPSVVPTMLWERFEIELPTGSGAEQFMRSTAAALAVPAFAGHCAVARPMQEPALFQYHPGRFRSLIPYAKTCAQLGQSAVHCAMSSQTMQAIAEAISQADEERIATQQAEFRWRVAVPSRQLMADRPALALFFTEFNRCGRQIFDFPTKMIEMFRQTSVDDVPFELLKLRYPCFYLHFGPQRDLELAPGWHPDGAYVSTLGEAQHLQMALTAAPPDVETYAQWDSHPDPTYIQAFPPELLRVGAGEAVDRVLSDRMAELSKQVAGKSDFAQAFEQLRASGALPPGAQSAQTRNASKELAALPAQHAAWSQMLRLVVNGLAYLSAYPEDIQTQWPRKTPQSLLAQVQGHTPKQRQRAASKLAALGFSPIHLCGMQFRLATENDTASDGARSVQTHWRTGHWKRQPYGPQMSLRKLQWRQPVMVNPREPVEDEALGHIYLVS